MICEENNFSGRQEILRKNNGDVAAKKESFRGVTNLEH
jgi:hypothetical protein